MSSDEALAAMKVLGLGECTFGMIPIGGYFKYRNQTEPAYRKTSKKWFVSSDGRKWTTGQNTAVFPVEPEDK